MKTVPHDECPPGQALMWLEPGDTLRVDHGEVLVIVDDPPHNPHFTVTTYQPTDPPEAVYGWTPATDAHPNTMIGRKP